MRSWMYSIRCHVGIALKLAGCALIHGRGRHHWANPPYEIFPGDWRQACSSCGKYRTVPAPARPKEAA